MTYSEIQKLLIDKYKELTEISNSILQIISQKNKLDTDLQVLQLRRQALVDAINNIEKKGIALLVDGLNQLDELKNNPVVKEVVKEVIKEVPIKKEVNKAQPVEKQTLKNKTEFSMQPIISQEKKGK